MKNFTGNCQTTAMGNLPHTNIEEAYKLAFAVDMPFFPQLPKIGFKEDLYVITAEHFPGIIVDYDKDVIRFSSELFEEELPIYLANYNDDEYFVSSPERSEIYNKFIQADLSRYPAIRGQLMGPLSFGFRIFDENKKPIIYNDAVREILYDFLARKINVQYNQLKVKNNNVNIWMDEPGMEMLFACYTGYTDLSAKEDYRNFLNKLECPIGIHLCGNPDWSFLLSSINIQLLSMNAFGCGSMFTKYHQEIKAFLEKGSIIAWGIVPTLKKQLDEETLEHLEKKLEGMWSYLTERGIDREMLIRQSMLTPSSCCMVNNDGGKTVEEAFELLKKLSMRMREKYGL